MTKPPLRCSHSKILTSQRVRDQVCFTCITTVRLIQSDWLSWHLPDLWQATQSHILLLCHAGTLHGSSYPDTMAFLRSLAGLHRGTLTAEPGGGGSDSTDLEAASNLFDWQVLPLQSIAFLHVGACSH